MREAEDFMAAEKAKGIKPEIRLYKSGYTAPLDTPGKWAALLVAGVPKLIAPVPLWIAGEASTAAIIIAGRRTPVQDAWYFTGADIQYGRYVPYSMNAWEEDGRTRVYRHYTPDLALAEAGQPGFPCEVAKLTHGWINNEGANRWKRTQTHVTDREVRKGMLVSTRIHFSVFYKTVKPEGEVDDSQPAYCTPELAQDHFGKILDYMKNL